MNINIPEQKQAARRATLYARVSKENKQYLATEARAHGFRDLATFVNALFTEIRTKGKVTAPKRRSATTTPKKTAKTSTRKVVAKKAA